MTSLADTSELEEELRQAGAEYNDLDFDRKLTFANERRVSHVGKKFIETKTIEFKDETTVSLEFAALISFDKAVDEEGVIDSSNYTVNEEDATVDFTQSFVDDNFFEGYELEFYHTPQIFKQLEIFIAMRNILETEYVQTPDEVNNTVVSNLNTRINSIISRINGQNTTATQHGDNQNIGAQPPRRYATGE